MKEEINKCLDISRYGNPLPPKVPTFRAPNMWKGLFHAGMVTGFTAAFVVLVPQRRQQLLLPHDSPSDVSRQISGAPESLPLWSVCTSMSWKRPSLAPPISSLLLYLLFKISNLLLKTKNMVPMSALTKHLFISKLNFFLKERKVTFNEHLYCGRHYGGGHLINMITLTPQNHPGKYWLHPI